jgi:hypothetical protein
MVLLNVYDSQLLLAKSNAMRHLSTNWRRKRSQWYHEKNVFNFLQMTPPNISVMCNDILKLPQSQNVSEYKVSIPNNSPNLECKIRNPWKRKLEKWKTWIQKPAAEPWRKVLDKQQRDPLEENFHYSLQYKMPTFGLSYKV